MTSCQCSAEILEAYGFSKDSDAFLCATCGNEIDESVASFLLKSGTNTQSSICICSTKTIREFGVSQTGLGLQCNSCKLSINQKVVERVEELMSARANDSEYRPSRTINRTSLKSDSLSNVNSIVGRMWVWILIQAVFYGVAIGILAASLSGGSFSFIYFAFAFFGVIATFAPLIFVVEALREIVRSVIEGIGKLLED